MTITDLEYDPAVAIAEPESGWLAVVDDACNAVTEWAPVVVWHSAPGVANLLNDEVVMPVVRTSTVSHMHVRCECGEFPYGHIPAFVRAYRYRPCDTIIVIIVHGSSA
jgi:hypothetical protein